MLNISHSNWHFCSTDCYGGPGTDCVVGCKTGQPCFAQVIGSRRPHQSFERAASAPGESALVELAPSQANFDVRFTLKSRHVQRTSNVRFVPKDGVIGLAIFVDS